MLHSHCQLFGQYLIIRRIFNRKQSSLVGIDQPMEVEPEGPVLITNAGNGARCLGDGADELWILVEHVLPCAELVSQWLNWSV